ncbi:MAG: hypothetical protein OEV44_01175 [Spirochaetota bacterium]|nr:hypothetical protein [Spirochaetota bacterium]
MSCPLDTTLSKMWSLLTQYKQDTKKYLQPIMFESMNYRNILEINIIEKNE